MPTYRVTKADIEDRRRERDVERSAWESDERYADRVAFSLFGALIDSVRLMFDPEPYRKKKKR